MEKFEPFANDTQSLGLGDLTVENGADKVSIYGSLDVTRDKAGLEKARALKAAVDAIVRVLGKEKDLPDHIAGPDRPMQVKNPFA